MSQLTNSKLLHSSQSQGEPILLIIADIISGYKDLQPMLNQLDSALTDSSGSTPPTKSTQGNSKMASSGISKSNPPEQQDPLREGKNLFLASLITELAMFCRVTDCFSQGRPRPFLCCFST